MSDASGEIGSNSIPAGALSAFIERIELLEEEKQAIADDVKEVYSEAKGTGFDSKVMRKIVSLRKQDRDTRREMQELMKLYMDELGMQGELAL